ncbi:hypothetical protein R1sor_019753 [Riccia sorocarpa]|uniref:Aldose 1-epimerase n=1 Tax=Riccia sorocarpa TaxID=122646 RepID=A0ABD3IEI0_9MARC
MEGTKYLIEPKEPDLAKRREARVKLSILGFLCLIAAVFIVLRCIEVVRMEENSVDVEDFGVAQVYTLKRGQIEVKVTNWGATVMSLKVPDSKGQVEDIVLGFDSVKTYVEGHYDTYFGAIVGRVANRIANSSFELDGKVYHLPANNGPNCLHGGLKGFDKVLWQSQIVDHGKEPSVQFTYDSPDGDQGFPGELQVTVTYTLGENSVFRIDMAATPGKKATPVNLASHSYFNLQGQGSGDVLGHEIQIYGASYTPVDDGLIPTGETVSVKGTPFDFLEEHPIGSSISELSGPPPVGYDNNYVLNGEGEGDALKKAARVVEPVSGRVLELWTTAPGMQFYTGNFLNGVVGKGGVAYHIHDAFCLETQGYPNAINEPKFPSVVVHPGQTYKHVMVYRFSTRSKLGGLYFVRSSEVVNVSIAMIHMIPEKLSTSLNGLASRDTMLKRVLH